MSADPVRKAPTAAGATGLSWIAPVARAMLATRLLVAASRLALDVDSPSTIRS